MKILFSLLLFILTCSAYAQSPKDADKKLDYNLYTGLYQVTFFADRKFNIYKDGDKLMLEIVGQGRVDLIYLGNNKFKANHVKPEAIVEFIPGTTGLMTGLKWIQKAKDQEWYKVAGSTDSTGNPLIKYAGKYKSKGNAYFTYIVGVDNDHLTGNLENEGKVNLYADAENYFVLKNGDYHEGYRFIKNDNGEVTKLIADQHGAVECVRISSKPIEMASSKHNFFKRKNFTHADTLLGKLSPLRTCYDVQFYHLNVTVLPASKSIKGSNLIRFKSVNDFDEMQIDLFANMKINRIVYHDKELTYQRDEDAVFIKFPAAISMGTTNEIEIFYEGEPQGLDIELAHSGWIWYQDKNEKPWIESVSQGSGASLWWPCKDHLSDKPDSMELSVTISNGLSEISNGKLISKTALPGNQTRFNWYISYPINTYGVVVYIGDYIHFSDLHINGQDTLQLNYYSMAFNEEKAKEFFTRVNPMLNLYEKCFGPYPFKNDGFALVESPYGMEHQSAVSMGSFYNPPNSNQYDSSNLINTLWHETAHEWWGNSITCKDYADFWIHESFATYAELLARKNLWGKEAYQKVINNSKPDNKEPIIGFYDVNDFHMGDVYSKGSLMLATLQNVVNNDSAWFGMLHGIQERFRYQAITTEEMIGYINESLKADYTYFFNQYLRYPAIPELVLKFNKSGSSLTVSYKWEANVKPFRMPVKVTASKNGFEFIYPSTEWKTILLQNMAEKDFKVDTDDFYIGVKYNKN